MNEFICIKIQKAIPLDLTMLCFTGIALWCLYIILTMISDIFGLIISTFLGHYEVYISDLQCSVPPPDDLVGVESTETA